MKIFFRSVVIMVSILFVSMQSQLVLAASPSPLPTATTTPVDIQFFRFNPDPIVIPVGGTITWTNKDAEVHNAVGDGETADNTWNSGALNTGQSFSKTFTKPGIYTYTCTFHPNMVGTVQVGSVPLLGDLDGNNRVDIFDYNILLRDYGKSGPGFPGDIIKNDKVDIFDYNALLRDYGKVVNPTPTPSTVSSPTITPTSVPTPKPSGTPMVTPTPAPTATTSWDSTKATHLARRVLPDPSNEDINQLASLPSAAAAVDLLFTPASATEQANYQNGLQQLINTKSTYTSVDTYEYTLYTYKMVHDPNRAQRRLAYLWENIFSVDAPVDDKTIAYDDVTALHTTLYNDALGNYITLVTKMQTNYAMAQYLDLTSSKLNNPNENYARELMQLFLMGPYGPRDKTQTTPNYTDADVNSLAYILTGYVSDLTAHTVSYDNAKHYQPTKLFLGAQYNDPANAVTYIVTKRRTQISEFLANKLLKFYVTDSPTDADIISLSQIIQNNNFEILPTLKQLLASDMMYKTTYMQEDRFKTPFELASSYYSFLYKRNNYTIIPSAGLLTGLNFQPFRPGSIFGRDGFNEHLLFYSGSILSTWTVNTNSLVNNISTANMPIVMSNLIPNYTTLTTPAALVDALSNVLYLQRTLPQTVKDALSTYLITGNSGQALTFNLSDANYLKSRMPGLLSLMLVQPEFVQHSGNLIAANLPPVQAPAGSSLPKLIVIRQRGGVDNQGTVANISDSAYPGFRKHMQFTATNSASLGSGYMLNNAANSLLPLVASKEARFINAVGFPNHSRAHDVASVQMETGLNSSQTGILAQLINTNSALSVTTFSNSPPFMAKGAPSLQIGTSSLLLYPGANVVNSESAARKKYLLQSWNNRKFPQSLALYYAHSLLLDQLATNNIAQGGSASAGYTNTTQFAFLDLMITQNVGNVFYLYGDGGYDHHVNEDIELNPALNNLYTNIVNFYNKEKVKTKLAIVIFTEFGRTNRINGDNGTDHGQGNEIVILSNDLQWPTMIGNMKPSTDVNNWTTVNVDARDVWSTLFRDLYATPVQTLFGRSTTISNYPVIIP